MKCNEFGTLWPRPRNIITWNDTLMSLNRTNVNIQSITQKDITAYWEQSMDRFNQIIDAKIGHNQLIEGECGLSIELNIETDSMELNTDTDEQYQLELVTNDNEIVARISSFNYFGARHALETLSQLIAFDEFSNQLKVRIGSPVFVK